MDNALIQLEHGDGGLMTHRIIKEVFVRRLGSPEKVLEDSSIVESSSRIAITTDSFVVSPWRFPGGDIGKLAVAGTYNDLVVRAAVPKYMTAAFILEEGLRIDDLDEVVASMAAEASRAGISVVAGDTKVVPRGHCDGIYISASGVGFAERGAELGAASVKQGDVVIVTGDIGRHGATIMAQRLGLHNDRLESDCQAMTFLVEVGRVPGVHCMRDLTRGGLATALCEVSESSGFGIELRESEIPLSDLTAGVARLAGVDPLFLPCEGTAVIFCDEQWTTCVVDILRKGTINCAIIGRVHGQSPLVRLVTKYGGTRRISMLIGAQLPRMC